jgi:hypothetical protein
VNLSFQIFYRSKEATPLMLRMDVVSVRVSSVVHELHPTLLKELDEHVETMGSHDNLMLKKRSAVSRGENNIKSISEKSCN